MSATSFSFNFLLALLPPSLAVIYCTVSSLFYEDNSGSSELTLSMQGLMFLKT